MGELVLLSPNQIPLLPTRSWTGMPRQLEIWSLEDSTFNLSGSLIVSIGGRNAERRIMPWVRPCLHIYLHLCQREKGEWVIMCLLNRKLWRMEKYLKNKKMKRMRKMKIVVMWMTVKKKKKRQRSLKVWEFKL